MGELTHLKQELEQVESVVEPKFGESGKMVVTFESNVGEYGCLTSEMLTVIGRYDCNLYKHGNVYVLIAP